MRFTDGRLVPCKSHEKYLGAILEDGGRCHRDVSARITKARGPFKALQGFWRNLGLSVRWKRRVFDATFVPMLLYGMDAASLSENEERRLEATYRNLLRKLYRIPSTYYTKVLELGDATSNRGPPQSPATK